MFLFWALIATAPYISFFPQQEVIQEPGGEVLVHITPTTTPLVPFYSQLRDIHSSAWRKNACGIASLAMIIEYYRPDSGMSPDALLNEGIALGAYDKRAGWSHAGLIRLAEKYGLEGERYDLGTLSAKTAFAKLSEELERGPVIASVHYNFDPKSTIPHLVVVTGIEGDSVHYNDPAAKGGDMEISAADFLKAWKKRFIVIRPAGES